MTDLELIFTMLGEKSTTEIARDSRREGVQPKHERRQGRRAGGRGRAPPTREGNGQAGGVEIQTFSVSKSERLTQSS